MQVKAHGVRVEVEGLGDDDTPCLRVKAVCLGCGAVLHARDLSGLVVKSRRGGIGKLQGAAEALAVVDAEAVLAHVCLGV